MTIKLLDLFAAGGGWDEGAMLAGIKDSLGIELDMSACETAEAAGHKRLCADITELDPHAPRFAGYTYIHASPVCTTFTAAGKGSGRRDLDRLIHLIDHADPLTIDDEVKNFECEDFKTKLTLEPLRWIHAIKPDYITMEQVPQVLPVWEAYARHLSEHGYYVCTGNLQAEQYGVPPTRRRAIFMASKHGPVSLPTPTHSKYHRRAPERLDDGVQPWVSMADALTMAHDSHLVSNYGTGGDPANRGIRKGNQPAPTVTSKINRNKWVPNMLNKNGVLDNWPERRPSTTVTGSFRPDIIRGPGFRKAGDGPCQNAPGGVKVEPWEAGVLQSFRADYPWRGNTSSQYQQIGNAVPPLLAKAVIEALLVTADN